MSEENLRIRADSFGELCGLASHKLGNGIYLMPTEVMVGVATPEDISDETGEPTLKFHNTRVTTVDVDIAYGGTLVAEFPDRDELNEMFLEAADDDLREHLRSDSDE